MGARERGSSTGEDVQEVSPLQCRVKKHAFMDLQEPACRQAIPLQHTTHSIANTCQTQQYVWPRMHGRHAGIDQDQLA